MCQIVAVMGVTHMDLMWADLGERLSITVAEMRSLRAAFGDLLGLNVARRVPENLVPVIALIVRLRQKGVPDPEIERRLREARVGEGWPEDVLARMQAAATASPLREPERGSRGQVTEAAAAPPALALVRPEAAPESPSDAGSDYVPIVPERTVREMVMDLRREICTQTVEERELLHRMNQLLQNLVLEVRDLRWAFILASSRKDRKRGRRGIARLLSG